jgi:hypothetical protein
LANYNNHGKEWQAIAGIINRDLGYNINKKETPHNQ